MGFPATYERLHELQEEFDSDGSGELDLDEVFRLVSRYREKEVQMVRKAFDRLTGMPSPISRKVTGITSSNPKKRGARMRSSDNITEQESRTIPVSELRNVVSALGYWPSKEQEVALTSSLDEGSELSFWQVMGLMERFRAVSRDEFQQNQGFTKPQLEGLQKKFGTYDSNGDGHIKHSEVANLLLELYPDAGCSVTARAQVEELLKIGGVKETGYLDFAGYTRIMRAFQDRQDLLKLQKEQETMSELNFSRHEVIELRQVFGMFDADTSGSMSIDELASMVSVIVPDVKGGILEDLKQILLDLDEDGNRTLDFIEFLKVVKLLQEKDWHGFNQHAAEKGKGGNPGDEADESEHDDHDDGHEFAGRALREIRDHSIQHKGPAEDREENHA